MHTKIKSQKEVAGIISDLQGQGKVIVTTNGCFDILHVGHVRYLQETARLGDILVVGLNSDISVKLNKGSDRPIVPQDERAEMLAALGCVDYVVMFDEKTPEALLDKLKTNIHVKAGDYTPEQMPETAIVRKHGGYVHIARFVDGKSTTNIIEKVKTLS